MPKDRRSTVRKERGVRAKYLRTAANLSRQKMCVKYAQYGLSPSLIQNWENGRWEGVSEKIAGLLTEIFKQEGIDVSADWLLTGNGITPLLPTKEITPFYQERSHTILEEIHKELNFFRHQYPHTLEAVVEDGAMLPYLQPGDYVAGKIYTADQLTLACGLPCIVILPNQKKLIRILEIGNKPKTFDLLCGNPYSPTAKEPLRDITLQAAAPIIWIRRPLTPENLKLGYSLKSMRFSPISIKDSEEKILF